MLVDKRKRYFILCSYSYSNSILFVLVSHSILHETIPHWFIYFFPPINNTQSPRNPDIIILSKKKNINTTYVRKQGSTISE